MSKFDENTIVLSDKIYIPAATLDEDLVERHYSHVMYEERACKRCPNRPERHNSTCDSCEHYKGTVNTYKFVCKKGVDYFGIPIGHRKHVERALEIDFDDYNKIDLRVKHKFDYKIKLNDLEMRDYQDTAVKAWQAQRFGMIIAPPRSGKTPLALYIAVKLGVRTMYMAGQNEFLTQFIDHVEQYTNLPELQDKYDIPLYGFAKRMEDYETLQIATATYQQFFETTRGKERFAAVRKNFGNLMVDEADKAGSNEFARVINNHPAKYKTGFTGTDKRKDGRHKITEQVVGDIICRIQIPQMTAKLIVHVCDYVKTRSQFKGKAGFTYCCKFLAKHKKRMEQILEYVGKDLEAGHNIVIPVYHREHVTELKKLINDRYGAKTCEAFVGGASKRDKELRGEILERAKSGKTRVIVGIRSILQRGLNVPKWSALYNIMPMNNESNWKQESSRVLTPMENKRQPIIRFFVDPHIPLSLGCFVSTYKQSIAFHHEPTPKAAKSAKEMMVLKGGYRDGDEIDVDNYMGTPERTLRRSVNNKQEKPAVNTVGLFSKLKRLK